MTQSAAYLATAASPGEMLGVLVMLSPIGLAQNAFERFSSGTAGEVFHDHDPANALILGIDPNVDPISQFFSGDEAGFLQNRKRR